jgi:LmbE family N-acetylglucosaminyl deacetylase
MHIRTLLFWLLSIHTVLGQAPKTYSAADIRLDLNKLNTVGSVLYLAAHPDDENTRLITWLANEKCVRTAYLSLTRGDGGQNLIGTEKSELIGVLRTQELLAARRTDGGEQFFTRAVDFGYSKNPEETFTKWEREQVLSDVVWVIRKFRPDVIITRFPPTSAAGHGHHTASAMLAEEAFDLAADPNAFPEQLKYVKVWQPLSLYHNASSWWNKELPELAAKSDEYCIVDIGEYNPILGRSYNEIAAESRSQHRSQGFGSARQRGKTPEYLRHMKGKKMPKDLFSGIDLSWKRIKGSEKIAQAIEAIIKNYDAANPAKSVQGLVQLYSLLDKLPDEHYKAYKKEQVKTLILACAGLWAEAVSESAVYGENESIKLLLTLLNRSSTTISVKSISLNGETINNEVTTLKNNEPHQLDISTLAKKPFTHPYWLEKPYENLFEIEQQTLRDLPENSSQIPLKAILLIENLELEIDIPVVYKSVDRSKGELYEPIAILPVVSMKPLKSFYLFNSDAVQEITVSVKANRDSVSGVVKINVPYRWKPSPESQPVNIARKGDEIRITFQLMPTKNVTDGNAVFSFEPFDTTLTEVSYEVQKIDYEHIPTQYILKPAQAKVVKMDLKLGRKNIAYLMGSGDEIPQSLEAVGYAVTLIEPTALGISDLSKFDAVITGVRAYNTLKELEFGYRHLLNYVKNGGNLIVQYNTQPSTVTDSIGPYPIKFGRGRVTDENAAATLIKPEHPVFNFPNKITAADFDGWVQERGLYFAQEWDSHFEPLIRWNDSGEAPQEGALLYCSYGKGTYIFTGISFFRQLPAGVPGAYRLFANLINAGK